MNSSSSRARACTVVLAAIAWAGVLLQCYPSLKLAVRSGKSIGGGLLVFLGYFTVLTNLLVGASLALPLMATPSAAGRFFSRADVLAGIAVNIAFVGLSYHFLLRKTYARKA
jgi:hypothetical protein